MNDKTAAAESCHDNSSATSSSSSSTTATTTTTDLKRIGQRTRRLLEEERKKRKEIVHLKDGDNNDDVCYCNRLLVSATTTAAASQSEKKKRNADATAKKQAAATIEKGTNATLTASTTGRKRKLRLAATAAIAADNANIDEWMPNVEDLLQQQEQQQQILNTATANKDNSTTTLSSSSNIVRLHGLPTNVKPEQIRKLFHGLHPIHIFVLPTFIQHIYGWDTIYHNDDKDGNYCSSGSGSGKNSGGGERKKNERSARRMVVVKRQPYHFRVFVKFTSSLVANIAIDRSGESIIIAIDDNTTDNDNDNKIEACIAITPVSKMDASFMQRYMAIPTQKGESIVDTLTNVERRLSSSDRIDGEVSCGGVEIIQLLWQMAIQKLNLIHQPDNSNKKDNATRQQYGHHHLLNDYHMLTNGISCSTSKKNHTATLATIRPPPPPPMNKHQYQQFAKLYNQLIDIHTKLELEHPLFYMHTFDPTISIIDPVHKITSAVSNWLLDEIVSIQRRLMNSTQ